MAPRWPQQLQVHKHTKPSADPTLGNDSLLLIFPIIVNRITTAIPSRLPPSTNNPWYPDYTSSGPDIVTTMADSEAQTPRDSGTFDKERPLNFDVEKGEQSDLDGATIQAHSERGVSTHSGNQEKAIVEETEQDPNIVDWDGPDDPENPMNWPDKKKWLNVAVLSILTIIT